MLRYKLRTLLIVLALGPPMLAWGWHSYVVYARARELAALRKAIEPYDRISYYSGGGRSDPAAPNDP